MQRAQAGGNNFMQGFTLPGECDKAAKILKSFLGTSTDRGCCVWGGGWRRRGRRGGETGSVRHRLPRTVLEVCTLQCLSPCVCGCGADAARCGDWCVLLASRLLSWCTLLYRRAGEHGWMAPLVDGWNKTSLHLPHSLLSPNWPKPKPRCPPCLTLKVPPAELSAISCVVYSVLRCTMLAHLTLPARSLTPSRPLEPRVRAQRGPEGGPPPLQG